MLRHSVSQIFSSPRPYTSDEQQEQNPIQELAQEADRMISSLQPSRLRVAQFSATPPLNQQPSRALSPPPFHTSSFLPTPIAPAYFPRNQIEAMPPFPLQATVQTQMWLDPSKRHPVFFTDRLKKAPEGVHTGGEMWAGPVTKGYIFNDGVRRAEGGVKL